MAIGVCEFGLGILTMAKVAEVKVQNTNQLHSKIKLY